MVAAVLAISPDDEPSNNDKWIMVVDVFVISPDDEPQTTTGGPWSQLSW